MSRLSTISTLPNHIAIIPDGNRRWAREKGLRAWEGHRQGIENLEEILNVVLEYRVQVFSFWGASLDNIEKRPRIEVLFLLNQFREKFLKIASDAIIHEHQVRINVFGKWKEKFPSLVCDAIQHAIESTKQYKKFFLNFLLAYNGTDEMMDAFKKIAALARSNGTIEITPELIKQNLFTANLPPVDYIIRTGGEPHNSAGFMMWDSADAQYYFTNTLFPDFHREDFIEALKEYERRERRFGK